MPICGLIVIIISKLYKIFNKRNVAKFQRSWKYRNKRQCKHSLPPGLRARKSGNVYIDAFAKISRSLRLGNIAFHEYFLTNTFRDLTYTCFEQVPHRCCPTLFRVENLQLTNSNCFSFSYCTATHCYWGMSFLKLSIKLVVVCKTASARW